MNVIFECIGDYSRLLVGGNEIKEVDIQIPDRIKPDTDGLKKIPTHQLVKELMHRDGVDTSYAEPYQAISTQVDGPAVVLIVKD